MEKQKRKMDYKWVVLSNTTIAILMASIDTSIVIISLPYILRSVLRHIPGGTASPTSVAYAVASADSFVYVIWSLMGYMLITATLLIFFGRLADLKGRVKIYNAGFAVFTAGSLLAGFSGIVIPNSLMTEGIQLVMFRLLQAIGAAMLWSNSAALLTDAFPANQRGLALGTNMVSGVGGSILGLVLGGVITSVASWRYIFFINVPIGIFATLWAYMRLHEISKPSRNETLDLPGAFLFSGSIAALLLGSTFYTLGGMTAGSASRGNLLYSTFHPYLFMSYVAFAIFPLLMALFVVNEVKFAKHPLMKFSLFRSRMFTAGVTSSSLLAIGRGGIMFLLVFYFEGVKGLSAFNAGLQLIPMSLGFLLVGPISGILSDRIGSRGLTTAGVVLSAIALLILSVLPQSASPLEVSAVLALTGIGGGLFGSPNISSIMSSMKANERGVGAATNSTMLNVSTMIALTIAFVFIGTTVNVSNFITLFIGTTKNLPSSVVSSAAYQALWHPFMHSFHQIFAIFSVAVIIALIPSALRPRNRKQAENKSVLYSARSETNDA
ncbi:MAG: MFS transporter [Candidatus Thermoplasmatota archaeon]|uniref:MFS transporter n=2 Tax=Candidatus Sysuiplasma superficiale TaxID=2823368 RepID=A0A8J7YMH7_9ARCH|nr:MFS transporter [Candidatus Sysuiplasma superficiale]MCL4347022.1 MFS transporter [Candidatus Thermoplasmatota archaeon]